MNWIPDLKIDTNSLDFPCKFIVQYNYTGWKYSFIGWNLKENFENDKNTNPYVTAIWKLKHLKSKTNI